MTTKAAMRTGDLNRLLKAAKAHGYVVEIEIAGSMVRLLPSDGGARLPTDPLDAELAQWANRHGYD